MPAERMFLPTFSLLEKLFPWQEKTIIMIVACCVCVLCVSLIRLLWRPPLRHIPGPWLNKITQSYLAFYDITCCRNDQILKWHRQYGPIICISPNEVSVATLAATREIYSSSNRWAKSGYFDNFMGYNERSVFAAKSYQEHRQKRRLTSAFYSASNMHTTPAIEEHIRDRSLAALKRVESEVIVDVYSLTDHYALDNITFLVLGPQHCTQSIENSGRERDILEELKRLQFFSPLKARFPQLYTRLARLIGRTSNRHAYFLAEEKLANWCQAQITAATAGDVSPTLGPESLLQKLLQEAQTTSNPILSKDYIAAEVLDNINAAEATVAVTATYLIWHLTESPRWQHELRQELLTLSIQANGSSSFGDINQLPILEACLREVYRLHPASSGRAERLVPRNGAMLSGMFLPEDTIATVSVPALHQDERLFSAPDRFMPERWLKGDEFVLQERAAHLIPFGHGARICLGKALANMEIKILIASLYARYESLPVPSCTVESMKQCSTHDAVPKALKCMVRFRPTDHKR